MLQNRNKQTKVDRALRGTWTPEAHRWIADSIPESLYASLTVADLILVANALGESFRAGISFGELAVREKGRVWDVKIGHGRELASRHIVGPEHVEGAQG